MSWYASSSENDHIAGSILLLVSISSISAWTLARYLHAMFLIKQSLFKLYSACLTYIFSNEIQVWPDPTSSLMLCGLSCYIVILYINAMAYLFVLLVILKSTFCAALGAPLASCWHYVSGWLLQQTKYNLQRRTQEQSSEHRGGLFYLFKHFFALFMTRF